MNRGLLFLIGCTIAMVEAFGGSGQEPADCSKGCVEVIPEFVERCDTQDDLIVVKKTTSDLIDICPAGCPKRSVSVVKPAQCSKAVGGMRMKPQSSGEGDTETVETLSLGSTFKAYNPVSEAECPSGYRTFQDGIDNGCLEQLPVLANTVLDNGYYPLAEIFRDDVKAATSDDSDGKSFYVEFETSTGTKVTISFAITSVRILSGQKLLIDGVDADGFSYVVACDVLNCVVGSTDPFLSTAPLDSFSASPSAIGRRLMSYLFGEAKVIDHAEFPPLGCYQDASDRALKNHLNLGKNWSPAECCSRAKTAGYKFCGTQWYGECWAGNEGYDKHGTGTGCLTPCITSPTEKCGGSYYLSVYSTGSTVGTESVNK